MEGIRKEFWVQLTSSKVLAQFMAYRKLTVRELADKVGCSRATIGHLRSGKRKSCRPETARAIEELLEAPQGLLFTAHVARVAPHSKSPRVAP